jgi:superfamily II DNA/RNA helicase
VRRSGTDRKWEELSGLLQDNAEMFDAEGQRRKLVIFTEHRDTLNYLEDRIKTLLGWAEAVVTIHGGLNREARMKAQEAFTQDKVVQILVATDAAGEGINLQRAHLMVNYDLPWNPTLVPPASPTTWPTCSTKETSRHDLPQKTHRSSPPSRCHQ